MSKQRIVLAAALALSLTAPSCHWFRRTKAAPPPAPTPAATQPSSAPENQPPKPNEVSVPAPPELPPQKPDLTQVQPNSRPLPPPPKPRKRRAARTPEPQSQPPVPEQPGAAAPASSEPTAPVSQLGQILTAEQQQAYNGVIEGNINRAQRALTALTGRRLNDEQKTTIERVRTFIQQANEARKSDLFRAKTLSERASVLAEDLLNSIQ